MCVCVCVCVRVCIYMCVCIYIYIYTHIFLANWTPNCPSTAVTEQLSVSHTVPYVVHRTYLKSFPS